MQLVFLAALSACATLGPAHARAAGKVSGSVAPASTPVPEDESTRDESQDAPGRAYDGALSFTVENDIFTGSDNNYTNGVALSWSTNGLSRYDESSFVSKWGRFWSFLPFVGGEGTETYAAWSLGQEMHTPDDITDPDPPLDDQPMRGFSIWTAASRRGETARLTSGTCAWESWGRRRARRRCRRPITN